MLAQRKFHAALWTLLTLPAIACSSDPGVETGPSMGTGGQQSELDGTDGSSNNEKEDDKKSQATGGQGSGGSENVPVEPEAMAFNRVASLPVCRQIDAECNDDTETVAEIVAVTDDGNTLVYTDAAREVIGYVDIQDAASPRAIKTTDVGGEPTSVSIKGKYALVGVNTSPSYVAPSGHLAVFDTESQADTPLAAIDLGGQPDSVAVSPDGNFAAVVIENERDEEFTPAGYEEGDLPQLPAGKLVIVDLSGATPDLWTASDVALTGLTGATEPTDPEPEFVDINAHNIAVVTLQENNAIALVDLATKSVTNSFSAGTVDLTQVDVAEEDSAIISLTGSLSGVPREPDGVSWIDDEHFATADEGDWLGGSRGFTIFKTDGTITYSSGNTMDHMAVRLGHYPDSRSENKGNEPENIEFGIFDDEKLLFVNSERSNLVFVYNVDNIGTPELKQVLPAGVGPEGGLALPSRNLLIVASEKDDRGDKMRSALNIYERSEQLASYPTLQSADRADETPIPWSALSALTASSSDDLLYAVDDSFYGKSRILTLDVSETPAKLTAELSIVDDQGVLAALAVDDASDDSVAFSSSDLAALINDDMTVNLDSEGIAVQENGDFWVASEGSGTLSDAESRPLNSLNLLLRVNASGSIQQVVTLPSEINDLQIRFGFEGVEVHESKLYVTFQRAWEGEDTGAARIGIYDLDKSEWTFVFYPLDPPSSSAGGWVGLSDITSLGSDKFLILERDNQGGPDASIKKLYTIDLSAVSNGDSVQKTLTSDLMPALRASGGLIPEKVEGLALDRSGSFWVVNDNDGVHDNNGETQLINLGELNL